MKKNIFILVVFLLLSVGCNKINKNTEKNNTIQNDNLSDVEVYTGDVNPKPYLTTTNWGVFKDDFISFKYPKELVVATSSYVNYKNNHVTGIKLYDFEEQERIKNCEGDCIDSKSIYISYEKDIYKSDLKNYYNPALLKLLNKNTISIAGKQTYVIKGLIPPVSHNIRTTFVNGMMYVFGSSDINMSVSQGVEPESYEQQVFETLLTTVNFTQP